MTAVAPAILALDDFPAFVSTHWQVLPKKGGMKPFRLNKAQEAIYAALDALRRQGRQRRLKVLKYRQAGVSTFCTALMQHATQSHLGYTGLSIADKEDLPAQWLRRARRWWHETPQPFRPPLSASNRIELWFADTESRYYIASQGGKTPGMGYTIRGLHCSELGDWLNPTTVLDDLLPAIPKDDAEALVIYESTGEAVGGWWYDSWQAEDDWGRVFLPWTLQEEYRMDPTEMGSTVLDDEEKVLKRCGVKLCQLAWRRWMIRNEFEGDVDRFRCKYPFTEEEAWMDVGRLVFHPEILRHYGSMVKPPARRVRLKRYADSVYAEDYEGQGPCWEVWYEPTELEDFTVGGDVGEGKLSDPNDPRSDPDASSGVVLNRRRIRVEAVWRGRIDPDRHGEELLKAAQWYNRAYVSPEINSAGFASLAPIRRSGYPYLFVREGDPSRVAELPLANFGWKTLTTNRDQMIDDCVAASRREDHTAWEGKIVHHSAELLQEQRNFVNTKSGKREHRPGAFDDILFGLMIALQLHMRCPRGKVKPPAPSVPVRSALTHWKYTGGMDDFDPESDEDDNA